MTTPIQVGVTITGDSAPLTAATARGERALDQFARSASSAGRTAGEGFGAARRGVDSISRQLGELRSLAAGALGIGSVGQVATGYIQAADAATSLASRLRLVTDSSAAAARVQAELYRIAQESRTGYVALGNTYAQVARSTEALGIGQSRLLAVTKAVSQAVALSGGNEQGNQAALTQLNQGLAAGVLRGEELNSILEQTPRLAQAIAQGLGVGVGELKKLGEAGELTASRVLEAIERAAPQLAREFAQLTPTVEQSFQTLKNSAGNFVAVLDQGSGASSALAQGIQNVSGKLDALSESARGASATLGPIVAGAAAAAGVAALGVALTGVGVALAKIVAAGAPLVAMLAGPLGVLLGVAAAGVGVAAAVAVARSRAETADEVAREIADRAARIRELDQQLSGTMRNGHARIAAQAELKALRQAAEGERERLAQALGRDAAADSDLGASDARLRRSARDALDTKVFADGKSIAEVTKGIKTRENIYRDATVRMAELSKAYANEIAKANRGFAEPTVESKRLAAELQQQMAAVARERDQQLAALAKPAADAARERSDIERGLREREIGALSAVAEERLDMQREELADLASLGKRGLVLEEDRVRQELEIRRAYIEDLREVETEKRRILLQAAGRETDVTRRDQVLKEAGQAQAKLDDLTRQQLAAERAALRELEELASRRANAVITSIAQRVDAARAGVRQMLEAVEQSRLVRGGLEPDEARAQLAVQRAEAELAALRATEGATQELIGAREAELELMREQLRLARELAIDARVGKQQEGWRRAEEQWAERQAREQEKRDDEISRSLTDALMRGFENGKGLAENFRDTLKNMFMTLVLRPQIELLVKPAANAVNSILTRLLEGAFGGSGSAIDSAIAGGASVVDMQGRFVPALGGGGPIEPNSLYLVGDRGPEFLKTGSAGGRVYPNDLTQAMLGGGSRGQASVVVHNHFDMRHSVGLGQVVKTAAEQGAAMGAQRAQAAIAARMRNGDPAFGGGY